MDTKIVFTGNLVIVILTTLLYCSSSDKLQPHVSYLFSKSQMLLKQFNPLMNKQALASYTTLQQEMYLMLMTEHRRQIESNSKSNLDSMPY